MALRTTYAACTAAARREAYPGAFGLTYKARYCGCTPLTASNMDPATRAVIRVDARGLLAPVSTASFMMPIHCSTGSGAEAAAGVGFTVARPTNRVIRNSVAFRNERFLTDILTLPFKEFKVLIFWGALVAEVPGHSAFLLRRVLCRKREHKSQGSSRKSIGFGIVCG